MRLLAVAAILKSFPEPFKTELMKTLGLQYSYSMQKISWKSMISVGSTVPVILSKVLFQEKNSE